MEHTHFPHFSSSTFCEHRLVWKEAEQQKPPEMQAMQALQRAAETAGKMTSRERLIPTPEAKVTTDRAERLSRFQEDVKKLQEIIEKRKEMKKQAQEILASPTNEDEEALDQVQAEKLQNVITECDSAISQAASQLQAISAAAENSMTADAMNLQNILTLRVDEINSDVKNIHGSILLAKSDLNSLRRWEDKLGNIIQKIDAVRTTLATVSRLATAEQQEAYRKQDATFVVLRTQLKMKVARICERRTELLKENASSDNGRASYLAARQDFEKKANEAYSEAVAQRAGWGNNRELHSQCEAISRVADASLGMMAKLYADATNDASKADNDDAAFTAAIWAEREFLKSFDSAKKTAVDLRREQEIPKLIHARMEQKKQAIEKMTVTERDTDENYDAFAAKKKAAILSASAFLEAHASDIQKPKDFEMFLNGASKNVNVEVKYACYQRDAQQLRVIAEKGDSLSLQYLPAFAKLLAPDRLGNYLQYKGQKMNEETKAIQEKAAIILERIGANVHQELKKQAGELLQKTKEDIPETAEESSTRLQKAHAITRSAAAFMQAANTVQNIWSAPNQYTPLSQDIQSFPMIIREYMDQRFFLHLQATQLEAMTDAAQLRNAIQKLHAEDRVRSSLELFKEDIAMNDFAQYNFRLINQRLDALSRELQRRAGDASIPVDQRKLYVETWNEVEASKQDTLQTQLEAARRDKEISDRMEAEKRDAPRQTLQAARQAVEKSEKVDEMKKRITEIHGQISRLSSGTESEKKSLRQQMQQELSVIIDASLEVYQKSNEGSEEKKSAQDAWNTASNELIRWQTDEERLVAATAVLKREQEKVTSLKTAMVKASTTDEIRRLIAEAETYANTISGDTALARCTQDRLTNIDAQTEGVVALRNEHAEMIQSLRDEINTQKKVIQKATELSTSGKK